MRQAIIDSVMETMTELEEIKLVDDITMKEFKALCLPSVPDFEPDEIKEIRNRNHLSQAAFASLLNISSSTVQKWERGIKIPSGATKKLLDIMDKKGFEVFI